MDVLCCLLKDATGRYFRPHYWRENGVSSLHMLAQALLGVEKTDRNRCTGLDRLYVLHPADVGPRLAYL